ncbi:MAG: TonB-dependent receptor [Pseudomonadota bacterium]
MKKSTKLNAIATRLLSGVALGAVAVTGAAAQVGDEIVVTAQRQEQSIQDVPLSVTAVGAAELEAKQIETFGDLQFNVPNFSFSRTQFTGSSIVIRGIGALAVAADSEPALSVHQNDMALSGTRLFETEFFDVERVEILRGPQGTLFGRNATGGVINVITNKADPGEVSASAEAQYGNFDHVQVKGHLNIPLGESAAVRVAGLKLDRDGYSENIFTGNDVDDRDISAVRGTLSWYPTDNTTVDLTAYYFNEEDSRLRSTKTLCTQAADPRLGCAPDSLGFDNPNISSTLNLLASSQTFGAIAQQAGIPATSMMFGGAPDIVQFGLFDAASGFGAGGLVDLNAATPANPADFRTLNVLFDPENNVEEVIYQANIRHDFDNFTVKLIGGYGRNEISQTQVQNNLRGAPIFLNPLLGSDEVEPFGMGTGFVPGVGGAGAQVGAFFGGPNGLPISALSDGLAGAFIGGDIFGFSPEFTAIDTSFGESEYYSAEVNVATSFEGPLNFLVGANWYDQEGFANFFTGGNALDYTAVVAASLLTTDDAAPGLGNVGFGTYVPYFLSDGSSSRESISVFGEVYWDITDELKFTGGVRFNHDEKTIRDRATLFDSFVGPALDGNPATNPEFVPAGFPDITGPIAGVTQGLDAFNPFREDSQDFDVLTGRAVLDWAPAPGQLYYASYSRGFKAGGFNPPASSNLGVSPTYDSEFINAFEIGAKLTGFMDGALTANLAAFYYDYSGLQVSRIVNRSSINDNVDATIWGVEGEFLYRPDDNWTFNTTLSYLNTDIGDFFAFDPANPTAGQADVDLIKDFFLANNCVIDNNGGPSLLGQDLGDPTLNALFAASGFSSCSTLQTVLEVDADLNPGNGLLPLNDILALGPLGGGRQVLGGIDQNLNGNELPGAPEFSFSVGAQYRYDVTDNLSITTRGDYYRQTSFFSRPFNSVNDEIDSWGILNFQVEIAPTDGPWYIRGFLQNALNDANITGSFLQDQSSGLVTNVFVQEPRRYGIAVGARF